jgi:DNA-binding CsgD family transcriptional regulator
MKIIPKYPNHCIDLNTKIVYRVNTVVPYDKFGRLSIRYKSKVYSHSLRELITMVGPIKKLKLSKKEKMERVYEMHMEGKSTADIIEDLGIAQATISRYLITQFFINHPEHDNTKITMREIQRITLRKKVKELQYKKMSLPDIAKKLNIHYRTAWNHSR